MNLTTGNAFIQHVQISSLSAQEIRQARIYLECVENAALLDLDISNKDIYQGRKSEWQSSVYGILNKEDNMFIILAKVPNKTLHKEEILDSHFNGGRRIGQKFFFQPDEMALFLSVETK